MYVCLRREREYMIRTKGKISIFFFLHSLSLSICHNRHWLSHCFSCVSRKIHSCNKSIRPRLVENLTFSSSIFSSSFKATPKRTERNKKKTAEQSFFLSIHELKMKHVHFELKYFFFTLSSIRLNMTSKITAVAIAAAAAVHDEKINILIYAEKKLF